MNRNALEGLKVCEFAWVIAGGLIGEVLAQYGATVVHLESERRVDIMRVMPPFRDNRPGINRAALFTIYNANKYGMALDFRHPAGLEVAKRLVMWSDIVTENFAPGRMDEWGLSYDELKKIKPGLIMLSTSHQGQTGPHHSHPGYGTHLVAMTGLVNMTGWPDRDGYQLYGAYTDVLEPPLAVAALLASVDYRNKTGKGQYIDISQFESSLHYFAPLFSDYEANRRLPGRTGNRSPQAAPHGVFRTKGDDRWCAIAVHTDEQWEGFCEVIGKPELVKDERFCTMTKRKENEDELERLVTSWTIEHTAEDIMMQMQRAKVPAGVVWNSADLFTEPQLTFRRHFVELKHPEIGWQHYQSVPFQLSETPGEVSRPAPCLGEHTEYVCKEILKMDDEEFINLSNQGILK